MIGNKIRELRKSLNLSQSELAKRIGVSQTTVTAWETGRAEPSGAYISSLADYFDVTTDYLLGRTKDSHASNDDLSENQKLIAYSIDPDISDEDRRAIIEMVQAAKKLRRRI